MTRQPRPRPPAPPAEYDFREPLRGILKARGMTAYQLAERTGFHRSVVTRYLKGESSITADNLGRIFAALGLKVVEAGRARKTTRATAPADEETPSAGSDHG